MAFRKHPAATGIVNAQAAANTPASFTPSPSEVSNVSNPAADLARIAPMVFASNDIAYVPASPWSQVPGCGVANLAYVPDFLLSAPAWFAGNAIPVTHALVETVKPYAVVASKQVLEGVGGLVSGSTALQQLVEVQLNLGNTTSAND
jgi:hypothetical protein